MIRAEAQYPSVAFPATFLRMKPPEIRTRLKSTGRSQRALADYVGVSKDSISRLLTGHRSMGVDEAERIKEFFGDDAPQAPSFVQIPVYGYAAAGGADRVAIANDLVLDRIEIPAGMTRGDAMAIRIAGDSMEPRLYSGELVIVERNVPPDRNGDCVLELTDGSAIVKQYRGQRDGFYFLRQYNPDEEVRIPVTKTRAIHAVKYRR